ncbi:hypothetical protein INT45_012274 [Circinella minor]|uniref:F-box domain-containing protein n=1 Tax=Circinella minor TaxID=1195481 RepID=A0A8H7S117_9FUNG|nr:hypothetical protein INT45_012274 [Circinella minor]
MSLKTPQDALTLHAKVINKISFNLPPRQLHSNDNRPLATTMTINNNDNDSKTLTQEPVYYKTLAQEIDETLNEIKSNPSNPAAYLHAAKLYSCQGDLHKAISIIRQGYWNVVLPSNELLFKQQLHSAMYRFDTRIDYINRCPYDVVCCIIDQIAIHCPTITKIECLMVCRSWRQKLLGYPRLWRDIDIYNATDNKKLHFALTKVSDRVQRLRIADKTRTDINLLFKTYSFTNLTALEIIYKGKSYSNNKHHDHDDGIYQQRK